MDQLDPFVRFLGIDETDDAATLLGLDGKQLTSASIEQALRKQLARVYGHPDGRSESAERVKRVLRRAADELRRPIERERVASAPRNGTASTIGSPSLDRPDFSRRSRPRLQLTEFDRQVLATLVSCGGWNATSRGRLVSLAAMHNVSVDGLMRVLTGLSDYGRLGGGHIEVNEITQGASTIVATPRRAPGELARAAAKAAERLTPELKEPSIWSTIKLSALFGLITIVIGIVFLRTLVGGGNDTRPSRAGNNTIAAGGEARPDAAEPGGARNRTPTQSADEQYGRLALFDSPPTFMGNALPQRVTTAADQAVELPAHFDDIERRLTVLTGDPSEALMQNWRVSIETIAVSWPHVQPTVRSNIDDAILEALYEASGRPAVVDTLLAELIPANVVIEPEDINIGAWQAGTLGRIAASRLPPSVTQQARRWLQQAVADQPAERSATPFRDSATVWLNSIAPVMAERSQYEVRFDDFWETWLTAHSALAEYGPRPDYTAFDASLLAVIEQILVGGADLANPGPSVNLIARLLNQLHYESNPAVRDRVLSWFDMDGVSIDDLWVLTSLFATYNRQTTWFSTDLVLVERNPQGSQNAYKRRFRDRIRDVWPDAGLADQSSIRAGGTGIPVDPAVASMWREASRGMQSLARTDDADELMRRLQLAADLNTAAALLAAGDGPEAQVLVDEILSLLAPPESEVAGGDPNVRPGQQVLTQRTAQSQQQSTARPGQAIGPDGQWAAKYEAARSADERIVLLQQLQQGAGTDLGPLDAAEFVKEVYRGQPVEVRSLAQQVLMGNFISGPEVAMHMLDHFPGTSSSRAMSDVIEQYANITLPEQQTRTWQITARRGLVEHALRLHPSAAASSLQEATESLAASFDEQFLALTEGEQLLATSGVPVDSLARVHSELQRRASMLVPTEEVPASLVGLNRRHQIRLRLAEGAMQSFVAHQLGTLDLIAYITVAEQPALANVVRDVLAEAARRRLMYRHVLQQSVHVELLIGEIWDMRMAGDVVTRSREPSWLPDGQQWNIGAIDYLIASLITLPRDSVAARDESDWEERLKDLRPSNPMAYFELAEEIADVAASPEDEALARRLFSLAGLMDSKHLARSACLALADLEVDQLTKRRMLALAALLDPDATMLLNRVRSGETARDNPDALIAVVDAISSYRQGYGGRAQTDLRTEGAEALLRSLDDVLPGGVDRFLEDIRLYRTGQPPKVYDGREIVLLRIQAGLLAGAERSWSADLLLERGRPLIEVDPNDLSATFGYDMTRPVYRDGRWAPHR